MFDYFSVLKAIIYNIGAITSKSSVPKRKKEFIKYPIIVLATFTLAKTS